MGGRRGGGGRQHNGREIKDGRMSFRGERERERDIHQYSMTVPVREQQDSGTSQKTKNRIFIQTRTAFSLWMEAAALPDASVEVMTALIKHIVDKTMSCVRTDLTGL